MRTAISTVASAWRAPVRIACRHLKPAIRDVQIMHRDRCPTNATGATPRATSAPTHSRGQEPAPAAIHRLEHLAYHFIRIALEKTWRDDAGKVFERYILSVDPCRIAELAQLVLRRTVCKASPAGYLQVLCIEVRFAAGEICKTLTHFHADVVHAGA